ncbi:hypothetical protein [Haloferax sulfurifontis]|uniref:Uncharacterized protein n=2 Tax=Haloferax sulfurifontis TaxID=255616 RepID=M0IIG5_9EURY|nr:hypothetical protein [Haloferax sulfurifontis]ELZ96566.1 hypothetical protein C441_04339 [Haloferax sulfurifontis ATCC BAA-897]GGC72829.1 hypothetical protein GCM10007209_38490 [Haloferax sulfurifontis]
MSNDEPSGQNGNGNGLPSGISNLAYSIEEALHEAETNGLPRHDVADLLERLAESVRQGYTEIPEHRGSWWEETHDEGGDE